MATAPSCLQPYMASTLLRNALDQAGATPAQMARWSGVSRTLVNDYLAARRQPSVAQLYRLLAAIDLEPRVTFAEPDRSIEGVCAWEATLPGETRTGEEIAQAYAANLFAQAVSKD